MTILDHNGVPMTPPTEPCDHGVAFDEAAWRMGGFGSVRTRALWPRLNGVCPKGCGFVGIAYASAKHYTAGDW